MDEIKWMVCPDCGHEQPDMGASVACEECGEGPVVEKSAPRGDAGGGRA